VPSTTSAPFLIGSPRPGISTSVSIRSIELAMAGGRKNVAARRDTENLMGRPPFPRPMAGLAPPEVDRALEARFSDALEYTRRLLRQPSVSATGEGIRECSELVQQMMADIGCKTRTWSKGGHPLVIGELDVGAPVTLIVYEMYDVQPVGDLNAWQAPPFAAEIRDLPGVGKAIIARGSTNSKGALANHLFTWKTIRDVDEMPVNLIILAEGEEEISSANFIEYIRTHRRELKGDAAIANDYSEDLRGVPTIYLGVKGCLYLTVWSRGNPQAGGPMDSEIHSSNAVWIGSPVWRLLQALNTLVDENQRPAIDGIWEDVVPPTKADSAMVKTLAKTFDPSAWLQEERTAKFKFDLPKDQLLLKYLFEPTVNICGIYSGYIEHGGTKTVLPHEAYAKIDIRLVKAMTVEGTLRKLRDHLKKRGYDDLRIEVHGPYGPAKTDPESWIAKAAVEAVQANGKEPEVWPSSGGTMPAFAFDEYLKLPWVSTGLGHGSRAHAPNEYASVDGMRRFMAGEASLLYAAAKRAPKRRR
jgi:acetylornithine deacetylase/succinyl-diaminopimelate desuccinylase-like protein